MNEKQKYHSRNPSEVSKKSTQEPMHPDEYDKEFVNIKKAGKLAPDDKRREYRNRGGISHT